ncbi:MULTISPECIES: DNA polymerase III subunit epsilon [Psychrobacter]|uniref:DNA polymerase III subunit epsilon n=1 Tax=Psychrobacter TaxID=497 RepID=UPI00146F2641|nr:MULTISPECIES: DNA polymerase III subunit epsilon [Psychrobacter]
MSPIDPLASKPNTTIAYTDGACKGNPGKGGWGAHLIFSDGQSQDFYGGEPQTTNNRMELLGAIAALEYSPHHDALEVWTDSGYVKKGITEWLAGWKARGWKTSSKQPVANQDLWQRLDQLCQHRRVSWHWVKGHAGHAGNELADQLANLGVTSSHTDNPGKKKAMTQSTAPLTMDNADAHNEGWIGSDPLGFDMMDDEDRLEDDAEMSSEPLTAESATYQNEAEIIPEFDGDTSRANPYFTPLLPTPIHQNHPNRQLIMDTETTGLDAMNGDRIIEVGIVELVGRKFTGEKLHVYINPNRGMDEEVIRIHGISEAFLADKPTFEQIAKALLAFMEGAEVIAHNASFDMTFLSMEFGKLGIYDFERRVTVTDSLQLAKQQYPGQKNTLDALVRRLDVGKQDRTFHGALLDSEILAEVYLAMTGGQVSLAIEDDVAADGSQTTHAQFANLAQLLVASSSDLAAQEHWLTSLASDYPALNAQLSQQ